MGHSFSKKRAPRLLVIAIIGLVGIQTYVYGQGPGGQPTPTPKAAVPIDLTGYWVALITEDWRYRMVTPAKGDYLSVPMTMEARKVADSWDPAKEEAAGNQCKGYGAPALMRLPGRLHITWQDDQTLRADMDAGTQTRLFHFGDWKAPAGEPTWQGDSLAQWESPRVPRGMPPPEPGQVKSGDLSDNYSLASRLGWRFAPHVAADPPRGVTADDALNKTLLAYEAADRDQSIRNRRWIMEHIPFATPYQLDRVAKLGVLVSVQDAGYNGNLDFAIRAVGKERAERQNPLRDMLERHLIVVAGSDYGWPTADDPHPNDPFQKFYYYVTRKTKDGAVVGLQEAISREEALRMFTVNSAYLTFEEKAKVSIEAGKLADFLVLSQDLMTVPDDKILSRHPLATYIGGRKVFSAANANF